MLIVFRKFKHRFKRNKNCNPGMVKLATALFVVGFLLLGTALLVESRIRPLVDSIAENVTRNISMSIINSSITENFTKNIIDSSNLVQTEKDSEGNVIALVTDTVKINALKADLMIFTTEKMKSLETQKIGIPLGTFFKNRFLYGRGPRLYVKIIPLGTTEIDFKNNFISAGINQTRHQIFLEIKSKVAVITPVGSKYSEIQTQIPVTDTVIVGNVPNAYTNIESVEKTANELGLSVFKQ